MDVFSSICSSPRTEKKAKIEKWTLRTFRTACKLQQKSKEILKYKPKLPVCPKTAVRSKMIIDREYFF